MPKVRWGINAREVDNNFDRGSQFKPYDGPIPANGVYQFRVKVLRYIAATKETLPQLRIGLELVPRESRKEERRYAGYFIMAFPPVSDKTAFRYVPFLDAIDVSVEEFANRTNTDTDGNIKSIGKWRNDGKEMILAELRDGTDRHGNSRKEIGWMGAFEDDDDYDEDDDEDDEAEEDYDEDEDFDDDEEPF